MRTSHQQPGTSVESPDIAAAGKTYDVELIVNGHDTDRPGHVYDARPTGADILKAAGHPVEPDALVLQVLRGGGVETIRLDERADLAAGRKFVLANADRIFRFTVDGKQYEWPHRHISGAMLRELAGVEMTQEVEQLRGGAATAIRPTDHVDLAELGVEKFVLVTKPQIWKLKVQGVLLEYFTPKVKVFDAMTRAGFDPTKSWHIYLIVEGHPKQEVSADFVVDLRTPGIEKIRLMQRNVDNGDGCAPRRLFSLLPTDHQYLDSTGLPWEAVLEGERRWLLIHGYELPAGYSPRNAVLALDIPRDYPAAQIDMFYFAPFVRLASGAELPSTQVRATIGGLEFQGWSRHRNGAGAWDPNSDSVRTHLALVETCLAKELGE